MPRRETDTTIDSHTHDLMTDQIAHGQTIDKSHNMHTIRQVPDWAIVVPTQGMRNKTATGSNRLADTVNRMAVSGTDADESTQERTINRGHRRENRCW